LPNEKIARARQRRQIDDAPVREIPGRRDQQQARGVEILEVQGRHRREMRPQPAARQRPRR
jgi:hypothetical protein